MFSFRRLGPNLFDIVLHGNALFTNGAEIYGMLPMRLEERPTASTPTNSWQGGRWMRGDCICCAREKGFPYGTTSLGYPRRRF